MSRYIDADALIEQMEADAEHIDNYFVKMVLYSAIDDVKNAPTADVVPTEFHDKCMRIEIEKRMNMERKKGEWIPEIINTPFCDSDDTGFVLFKCSICGYREDGESKFCANCGAEMQKGVKIC